MSADAKAKGQPAKRHTARVIVASNRAAAGVYPDRTGPLIVAWLREHAFDVAEPQVVPDGEPVADALRSAVGDGVDVVLTTGGTGISPTDRTPEATAPLLDRQLTGLADAIRVCGLPKVPTSVLSRGVAGVAGHTMIVNLPGSTGGVRDGLAVLDGVLAHALDQLRGGDHPRMEHPHAHASGSPGSPTSPAEHDRPAGVVLRAGVGTAPMSVDEHAALVAERGAGAVVTFAGVVRDHDDGRSVRELEYTAHPSAEQVIGDVAGQIAGRHPAVRALAVSHRIGVLGIGDVALACAVSAAHRGDAFAACAELVDEVKRQLPVWKRQTFADGTDEWVNCP